MVYFIFAHPLVEKNQNEQISETAQPPKKFTCQICNAHFATKTNVANHIRSVHGGKKDFLCAECDKTFSYRTSLLVHKIRVHEKIKFPCSRCESQYGIWNKEEKTEQIHNLISVGKKRLMVILRLQ